MSITVQYPSAGARMCDICLNATDHPALRFHEQDGRFVCQECLDHFATRPSAEALTRQWEEVMETRRGARGYDFLLAFSGGADSTAALKLLVEKYRMKVLAFTVDNGMKHDAVWQNCMGVTRHLGVDWLYVNDVKRASAVIVEAVRAADKGGCSRCDKGWRFPNYQRLMREYEASCVLTGIEIPYGGSIVSRNNPWLIRMMAAHQMPKKDIFAYISDLPWTDPGVQGFDTDCVGGGIGLELYRKRNGRHAPVILSFLCQQVRYGLLDREEELAKLNVPVPEEHWAFFADQFGDLRQEPAGPPKLYSLSLGAPAVPQFAGCGAED
ncbi:MAG TPA: phosphoadenosine phosphosulfate reductase family protein [Longimicrobiaceae bacterium]|nr:phosphoadenosine phosphosulfate reductase family protein [Longimicrobiaceae bacterium]